MSAHMEPRKLTHALGAYGKGLIPLPLILLAPGVHPNEGYVTPNHGVHGYMKYNDGKGTHVEPREPTHAQGAYGWLVGVILLTYCVDTARKLL